ncbi:ESPR-type extended signal peptide-containing protein, partial [Acinetobacter populi]
MNKIYRVIWNASLGAWVAVSEMAKGKTKSKTKTIGSVITVAGAIVFAPNVFAETGTGGGTGAGTAISSCTGSTQANAAANGIAIGCSAQAAEAGSNFYDRENPYNTNLPSAPTAYNIALGNNSYASNGSVSIGSNSIANTGLAVALGSRAQSTNVAAIAIGPAALSSGNTSLALGRQSAATGDFAQAIGNVAAATGKGTLAIGHSATATGYRSIAIGSPDIDNASSTGDQAGVVYQTTGQTLSEGQDSIAFGGGAQATKDNALAIGAFSKATGTKSVAIGTGAEATLDNSVAIGDGAKSTLEGGVSIGMNAQVNAANSAAIGKGSIATTASGTGYLTNQALSNVAGVISVGSNTEKRRIQNLADGSADSDAVTVAQLKQQKVLTDKQGTDTATALGGGSTYSSTTGAVSVPTYNISGNTYNNVGDALKASKTEVEEGKNITVTSDVGADGQTIYTVATADDVNFNTVTVGDASGSPITLDGTTGTITGLSNTTLGTADFAT